MKLICLTADSELLLNDCINFVIAACTNLNPQIKLYERTSLSEINDVVSKRFKSLITLILLPEKKGLGIFHVHYNQQHKKLRYFFQYILYCKTLYLHFTTTATVAVEYHCGLTESASLA